MRLDMGHRATGFVFNIKHAHPVSEQAGIAIAITECCNVVPINPPLLQHLWEERVPLPEDALLAAGVFQ